MAKSKKAPTPQELYFARKEREDREREAYLPPGLINHGNTCFANSVLQGLLATRFLFELVHFQPLPDAAQSFATLPIASRRSPLLTNGHGLAGSYEQDWVEGMPLGDKFVTIMIRAWATQEHRKRESLTVKEILLTIGRKYDQYLDFCQQDAHEFLRQLLDAMRMEEMDIIKNRQPPPPPEKKRRSRRNTARQSGPPRRALSPTRSRSPAFDPRLSVVREASSDADAACTSSPPPPHADTLPTPSADVPPEDKLQSFADMLFGGRLASLLVCEKCKKISLTHEDFNDLSLSIRPEDLARDQRRGRLRSFAKKLKFGPSPGAPPANLAERYGFTSLGRAGAAVTPPLPRSLEMVRSSSVPPSPMRRDSEVIKAFDDANEDGPTTAHDEPRRRSIDAAAVSLDPALGREEVRALAETEGAQSGSALDVDDSEVERVGRNASEAEAEPSVGTDVAGQVDGKESESEEHHKGHDHVEFVVVEKPEKEKHKAKDNDSWAKLSRRISLKVAVGLGRKDKDKDGRSRSRERGRSRESIDKPTSGRPSLEMPPRPSIAAQKISPMSFIPSSWAAASFEVDRSKSDTPPKARSANASPTPPSKVPTSIPHTASFPLAGALASFPSLSRAPSAQTSPSREAPSAKSPRAPKPTREEAAYLRRILADVPHVSSSPFAFLQRNGADGAPDGETRGQALWAKITQLTTVDECLRMFTAVEVLDGENMVGCRRCWKIANGVYRERKDDEPCLDDEDDGDGEGSDGDDEAEVASAPANNGNASVFSGPSTVQSFQSSSAPSGLRSAASSSTSLVNVEGGPSVTSFSTNASSPDSPSKSITSGLQDENPQAAPTTYGGLPIPSISTTAPESPATTGGPSIASPAATIMGARIDSAVALSSSAPATVGNLRAPGVSRRRPRRENAAADTDDASDSENDSDGVSGADSDASVSTFGVSDVSSIAGSPLASPHTSREHLPLSTRPLPMPQLSATASFVSSTATSPPATPPSPAPPVTASDKAKAKKVPRSKQVILRRAYKRYLIATPPPVLVVHLKRFQQTGKGPALSFSATGFRKLEDYVSFPEFLDLGPFLAPKKEDYGLGSRSGPSPLGTTAGKLKAEHGDVKCLYRLYAVVEHIGNMLGGHYVSYVSIPAFMESTSASSAPASDSAPATESDARTSVPSNDSARHKADADKKARQWAYISDTVVKMTTLEEVLKAKAYLCMYERI